MLVKWLLLVLNQEHVPVKDYSSYHLHKMLEQVEGVLLEDLPDAIAEEFSEDVILEGLETFHDILCEVLLTRFRSQLDAQHERELIEDWKGAFDNE